MLTDCLSTTNKDADYLFRFILDLLNSMEKYKLKKAEPMVAYKYNSELVFSYATVLNVKRNVRFAAPLESTDKDLKTVSETKTETETQNNQSGHTVTGENSLGVRLFKTYIEAGI